MTIETLHELLHEMYNFQQVAHVQLLFWTLDLLYQEYQDTSKQQDIKQQRLNETFVSGHKAGPAAAEYGVASPGVQLQLRNAQSLRLWQNLEAVQDSDLLTKISQNEIIVQEVSCLWESFSTTMNVVVSIINLHSRYFF